MIERPWLLEKKSERINITIEPSLKEMLLSMIDTDLSTYLRRHIVEDVENYQLKLQDCPEHIKRIIGKEFPLPFDQTFGVINHKGRSIPYKIKDAVSVKVEDPVRIVGYEEGLLLVKRIEQINPDALIFVS